MDAKSNGGPAFPLQSIGPDFAPGYAGMSLRDWIAGQVIASEVSTTDGEALHVPFGMTYDEALADYWLGRAEFSYLVADAMLAARKVPE